MRGVLATLTVMWLVAAAVGATVTGLFWLTLVSFAGALMTGAMGMSMILRPAEKAAPPAGRRAELTVLPPAGRPARSGPAGRAPQLRRAA